MIHISTGMVHWSFPTTGDQAADLGFLCFKRLLGCCWKPTPEKPTLSVQCIDIQYIYSIIHTVYTSQTKRLHQEKPITFQNMSSKVKRISSITDRHLSTKHLSIVYQSPPSPNQVQPRQHLATSAHVPLTTPQTCITSIRSRQTSSTSNVRFYYAHMNHKSYIKHLMPEKNHGCHISYFIAHTENVSYIILHTSCFIHDAYKPSTSARQNYT